MATNPIQFVNQVRAEVAKVVWPTRREVVLTTVMVFIMAALTAVFFALVDLAIRYGLQGILTFFGLPVPGTRRPPCRRCVNRPLPS